MSQKTALITGITGQDGSYLAEFLLDKGYEVHGIQRRASSPNTQRLDHILGDITLHYGDLSDGSNIIRIIKETEPDEIYNLGAQSDVAVSFETPEYTADIDAIGPLRILEAIRILELEHKTRFYQASSSELFGQAKEYPQNERTAFNPCSPYACAKLYAFHITQNYRNAYGIFASNGILFNHESPARGEEFVTHKITKAVAAISLGQQESLSLGNLDSQRDWGHAKDYVRGMWQMMQHDKPDDFVLATGQSKTVRECVEQTFAIVGITIAWSGEGADEIGRSAKTGDILVRVDPRFFRSLDVEHLIGDASKAKSSLGWEPEISFKELIREMVEADIERLK